MTNIEEYIKKELSKGFSKKEIKETLLKAEWPEDEVDKALKDVDAEEYPQHKHPSPKVWVGVAITLIIILIVGGLLFKYAYYDEMIKEKCKNMPTWVKVYNCAYEHGLIKAVETDENQVEEVKETDEEEV